MAHRLIFGSRSCLVHLRSYSISCANSSKFFSTSLIFLPIGSTSIQQHRLIRTKRGRKSDETEEKSKNAEGSEESSKTDEAEKEEDKFAEKMRGEFTIKNFEANFLKAFEDLEKQLENIFGRKPTDFESSAALVLMILLYIAMSSTYMYIIYVNTIKPDASKHSFSLAKDKQTVPFSTFIDKFLSAGEVKNIVYAPGDTRVVAFLHPDAKIDGKPYFSDGVVVEFTPEMGSDFRKFLSKFREAEAELGITSDAVPFENYIGTEAPNIKASQALMNLLICFIFLVFGWKLQKMTLGMMLKQNRNKLKEANKKDGKPKS